MKTSKEKENRDAIIFILAILFLAIVLISLGASIITYKVMRKEVKEIVANDELSEDELVNISQAAALYTRKLMREDDAGRPDLKANDIAVVSENSPETSQNDADVQIVAAGTEYDVDEEGIVKRALDRLRASMNLEEQDRINAAQDAINSKQDEYITNNTTIINKLSEQVQVVNKAQAGNVSMDDGVLYLFTE